MKTYDVIVRLVSNVYVAVVPALPGIRTEGATRDDALLRAQQAIEDFFKSAEIVTVTVNAPEANDASGQQQQATAEAAEMAASEFPLAEAWLRKMGLRRQDPNDPDYQSFLASLAFLKQEDRERTRREAEQLDSL